MRYCRISWRLNITSPVSRVSLKEMKYTRRLAGSHSTQARTMLDKATPLPLKWYTLHNSPQRRFKKLLAPTSDYGQSRVRSPSLLSPLRLCEQVLSGYQLSIEIYFFIRAKGGVCKKQEDRRNRKICCLERKVGSEIRNNADDKRHTGGPG
jgi:hypothetical protein